jgi:predicted CXXCH cytochrome family protein
MRGGAFRLGLVIVSSALLFAAGPASAAKSGRSDRELKLKRGARAELCVECHDGFEEKMKRRYLHTPLSEGDCTGCHDPHASNSEMLLAAESGALCYQCHEEMERPDSRSVHEVFAEGKCAQCHDPHSSDNKNILISSGSALCFECHEELGDRLESNEFAHEPVEEDCLECHTPHFSEKNPRLLLDAQPSLCIECHEVDKPFRKQHDNYPVQNSRCSLCHNPHGSSTEALLFDNVHDPVAEGECDECHRKASSKDPLSLKDSGYEICEGCHYEEIADMFIQPRVHWALLDKDGCINCHAPHGSANESMLKGSMISVCAECHADTVARQKRAATPHEPVAEGECTECHSPHGSDSLFILNDTSFVEVCGACHEWQAHSTHPIGEEVIDPRNGNISVDCSSCHRSHGTEYQHFIYFENKDDLCVQCHTDYRR